MIVAALGLSDHDDAKGRSDHHGQADYLCPICIAVGTIANGLAPSPPVIPLQLTATVVHRTTEPVRFAVALPRAAFQSRGPPVS